MSKGWKFALIKVHVEDEGTEHEEQTNLLVELYPLGPNKKYDTFCEARINSLKELALAKNDVERDGINTWFYNNGTFYHKVCKRCLGVHWHWTRSESEDEAA